MSFASESKKILENMETQKLRDDYDAELKRFRMQKHLIDVLKRIKVDELKDVGVESKNNIAKAISWLHSIDYAKMENSGATVFGNFSHSEFDSSVVFSNSKCLGLPTKPADLLYSEKKALRMQLAEDLSKTMGPVLGFAKVMDPSVFQSEQLDMEIVELESRRRQLTMDVATAKIRECQLLQECADLKFGPNQRNLAELLRSNVSIDQVKGE